MAKVGNVSNKSANKKITAICNGCGKETDDAIRVKSYSPKGKHKFVWSCKACVKIQ